MQCAIYARYSSDLQSDRSIEDQIRVCRKGAKDINGTVLEKHIYEDRAISGRTVAGRPGLANLLESAGQRPRPFDCVLTEDTSRLSRNNAELLGLVEELGDENISVYFVQDRLDTRDETSRDILLSFMGVKNAMYSRELGKKTYRGMEGKFLAGFSPGGKTYGYACHRGPDGTQIEIDDEQAVIIKLIFRMFAQGHGLKSIAASLNDQGVEPPGRDSQLRRGFANPTWCPNAIRSMLRNEKYRGQFIWGKTKWRRKRRTGKRVPETVPQEQWSVREAPELAIVDEQLWQAVRARIEKNERVYRDSGHGPRRSYLLSGLLNCGVCGAKLVVVRTKKSGEIFYRCGRNWQRGTKACPNNIQINGRELEDHILGAIRDNLLSEEKVQLIMAKANKIIELKLNEFQSEQQSLIRAREKVAKEERNLVDYIARYGDAPESVRRELAVKATKIKEFDERIVQTTSSRRLKKIKADPVRVQKWLDNLRHQVETDVEVAKSHISDIIGELIATPVSYEGQTGLRLTGKPKIVGVLGVIAADSNLIGSGGGI